MELMSSLLFCALVAHLPQAFGASRPDPDVKYSNSKEFHQMPMPKKVLLNINGPPLVSMVNDLQTVFMDSMCSKCIDCMERAMKAYMVHYHVKTMPPAFDGLHDQVPSYNMIYRTKRDSDKAKGEEATIKIKRTKPKKKAIKSVTVTKYNVDGDVFALKVKETNVDQTNGTQVSTCQIFSVKKSFPCDTEEGESLLTIARRKVIKKNKKAKDTNKTDVAPSKAKELFSSPAFRKRQAVDNSQVPDNFMTSLEEFY